VGISRPQSKEFLLRAQIQSNADMLRSATIVNAEIVQQPGRLGVLAPSAFADLLLVDVVWVGLKLTLAV
jgi:imidazolonepropionase-like amidohydrolase